MDDNKEAKERLKEIFIAHNIEEDFLEDDSLEIMLGILHDTTFFDEITPEEVENRLRIFKEDRNDDVKTHSMFSALVLVPLYCLMREERGRDVAYCGKSSYDKILQLYTRPEVIKNEALLQKYDVEEMDLVEAYNYCVDNKVTGLLINPDTENVKFMGKKLGDVVTAMDEYEMVFEDIMAEGLEGSQMDAVWFERFLGREVECELKDGTKFHGVINAATNEYDDAREDEAVYTPDDESEQPIRFSMGDIVFIRDTSGEEPVDDGELYDDIVDDIEDGDGDEE